MNPIALEFLRQVLRWLGVWLMTIGVPESLAVLTTHEDFIFGVAGGIMYAVADTGWLVAKWKQFRGRK